MYSRGKIVHKGCAAYRASIRHHIVKWCTKIDKCKHIQKFIYEQHKHRTLCTNTLYNIRRRLAGGITKTRNRYNLSGASHTHRHKYIIIITFSYINLTAWVCCVLFVYETSSSSSWNVRAFYDAPLGIFKILWVSLLF